MTYKIMQMGTIKIKNFTGFFVGLCVFILFSIDLLSKGFFYEVSKGNAKVYLFGSIHKAKKEAYPLDSIVESTFKNCKNIVFEINLSKVNPFEVMQYGIFKDTMTLEKAIPEKYFSIIDSVFRVNSFPKFFYNKLQPWMAVLLQMSLELNTSNKDFVLGIDLYLANKVDTTQLVSELETFYDQLNVFRALYDLSPEFFLDYFLIQQKTKNEEIEELFYAWLQGDTTKIIDQITPKNDATELEKEFLELLNDERNVKMVSKIEEFISKGDCYFVVVGSAHLFGEKGILNLLKEKGYLVKKL